MTPIIEKFIEQTATDLNLIHEEVYEVIRHQYRITHEQMYNHTSIEITGLGFFSCRPKKCTKRIIQLEKYISSYNKKIPLLTEGDPKIKTLNIRIENAQKEIDYLKTKLC